MNTSPEQPLVVALAGMTIATPDVDALARIFTHYFEWQVLAEGTVSAAEERAWGIAPGSAGKRFVIVRTPDGTRGMVRIVQGTTRQRVRPVTPRWAGVEIIVSRDIDALFERVRECRDFVPLRDPMSMDWSDFGSNVHRAFLGRAPGGTHLALTMGVTKPKGREFPAAQAWVGHVFDVPLMTADFERSSRFYREVLGMVPFLTSRFTGGLGWHELFGLPAGVEVRLDILKGDAPGTGLGGIEMQGYDASLIDDVPVDATRFDGGACMVTYTSKDIDATYAAVAASPLAKVLSTPAPVEAAPYRGGRAFTFLGPDGERFEVCEGLWT